MRIAMGRDLRVGMVIMAVIASFILIGSKAYTSGLDLQPNWTPLQIDDMENWAVTIGIAAMFIRIVLPKISHFLIPIGIISYLAYGVGIANFAATCLFFISCWSMGILAQRLFISKDVNYTASGLFFGILVNVMIFGLLLHFKLNYRISHILILVIPIMIVIAANSGRFRACQASRLPVITLREYRRLSVPSWLDYSAIVIFFAFCGYVAQFCFYPTVGYDDNTFHLRMWTELVQSHHYSFDYITQVWALAPFNNDLMHATISLVAGHDARGALNLGLLGLLLWQMWNFSASLKLLDIDRWLVIGLFVSTPMLMGLLTTLQTELFISLLCVGATVLLLENRNSRPFNFLIMLAVCALLSGTKLPGAVLSVILLSALVFKERKWLTQTVKTANVTGAARFAIFSVIAAFVAFHSYGYAWYVVGNPFFPLYNGIFKSIYFPSGSNFFDMTYITGISLEKYLSIFVNTQVYMEARHLTAGFQYFLLVPLAMAFVALDKKFRSVIFATFPALLYVVIIFTLVQYLRYTFPGMAVSSVLVGVFTSQILGMGNFRSNVIRGLIVVIAAANFAYGPGISTYLRWPNADLVSDIQRQAIVESIIPEKIINAKLAAIKPHPTIIYDEERAFGATLAGQPVYHNWYSPRWNNVAWDSKLANPFQTIFEESKADFALSNMGNIYSEKEKWRHLRHRAVMQFGVPILRVGPVQAYRIVSTPVAYTPIITISDFRVPYPMVEIPATLKVDLETGSLLAPFPTAQIAVAELDHAKAVRYSTRIRCTDVDGYWVAQVNWDVGPSYYRLIACDGQSVDFRESVSVPEGATKAFLYAGVWNDRKVWVDRLELAIIKDGQ